MIQPLVTGQRGEVSVVAFDRDINWLQDFTRSDDKIHDAIRSLTPAPAPEPASSTPSPKPPDRMHPRPGRKMSSAHLPEQRLRQPSKLHDAIQAVEREGIEVFAAHYSSYAMAWIAKPADFPEKSTLRSNVLFRARPPRHQSNHVKALAMATGGSDYSFARQQGIDKAIGQARRRGPQPVHPQLPAA